MQAPVQDAAPAPAQVHDTVPVQDTAPAPVPVPAQDAVPLPNGGVTLRASEVPDEGALTHLLWWSPSVAAVIVEPDASGVDMDDRVQLVRRAIETAGSDALVLVAAPGAGDGAPGRPEAAEAAEAAVPVTSALPLT